MGNYWEHYLLTGKIQLHFSIEVYWLDVVRRAQKVPYERG